MTKNNGGRKKEDIDYWKKGIKITPTCSPSLRIIAVLLLSEACGVTFIYTIFLLIFKTEIQFFYSQHKFAFFYSLRRASTGFKAAALRAGKTPASKPIQAANTSAAII